MFYKISLRIQIYLIIAGMPEFSPFFLTQNVCPVLVDDGSLGDPIRLIDEAAKLRLVGHLHYLRLLLLVTRLRLLEASLQQVLWKHVPERQQRIFQCLFGNLLVFMSYA